MNKPLILIVNDDGIQAKGIRNLIRIMNDFGDVVVVAPNSPQSAQSHAITIESPITCRQVTTNNILHKEFACSGTPVDCVKLAFNKILKRKPDLCVSGINHGSNSSINVLYSGTMAAAIEAALFGVPSIGFSLLDYDHNADFSESESYIRKIAKTVINSKMPNGICLNVNIPKSIKGKKIKGIKVCKQANANWVEEFEQRIDPKGRKYYWLSGEFINHDKSTDTDEHALSNHYISIVPVHFDMTAHLHLTDTKKIFFEN